MGGWIKAGFPQNPENEITQLSMTKLEIFPDHFHSQDSCNSSREIHYYTILETTILVTIFLP